MKQRLNKILAHAGVSSRRAADRLIREGRVTVNGVVARELGTRVDPGRDAVKVDGRRVPRPARARTYVMLHKPRRVVTTLADPQGRATVRDLLRGVETRVYPVGRLDFDSEGLVLLTDDGELARDLMHPRCGVPKTYAVKVHGRPDPGALRRLERGVGLDGRRTLPARIRVLREAANSWLEVRVTEGRKHLVRRMLGSVGHPVLKLKRIGYDGVELGELPAGRWRRLTRGEVARLRRAAGRPPPGFNRRN